MEKLDSVQYSAARAITGARKGTSRKKLLEELGWETLDLRRWSRRLVLFYKIVNNITHAFTGDPIPLLHELPCSFRTRPATGQIYARTDKYELTFYPNCLAEWENNDPETRIAPFFLYQCQLKKLKNTIQYSLPFIAEIDMSSSGSGYEQHLTNSLTTIEKEKKTNKKKQSKTKEFKHSVHHDITPSPALTSASMR